MTSIEEKVVSLLAMRPHARMSVSEDLAKRLTLIKSKCQAAEKQEADGSTGLQWRRGSGAHPHRNQGHGRSNGSSNGGGGVPKWRNTSSTLRPVTNQGERPHVPRYVSQFQNSSAQVEDKILNQIILNKLNKFSVANYEEIKAFLQQILDSNETEFLQNFMILVFKKAAVETTFCPLYAKMLSELSLSYTVLRDEMQRLYKQYMTIFEEVSESQCKDYETFVQRNREKHHRLGYSQFLAELTSLGVLEREQLQELFTTILSQIRTFSTEGETRQQLVDEYIDCLLRMCKAFQKGKSNKITTLRNDLANVCTTEMEEFLSHRTSKFPGISKKASFALMDCLDIFRDTAA
jgi:hypothetical protein